MPEIISDAIDKNDVVLKIEKLQSYIRKAKNRLVNYEDELQGLYNKQFGDKAVIESSLKRLKMLSKRRSMR